MGQAGWQNTLFNRRNVFRTGEIYSVTAFAGSACDFSAAAEYAAIEAVSVAVYWACILLIRAETSPKGLALSAFTISCSSGSVNSIFIWLSPSEQQSYAGML